MKLIEGMPHVWKNKIHNFSYTNKIQKTCNARILEKKSLQYAMCLIVQHK